MAETDRRPPGRRNHPASVGADLGLQDIPRIWSSFHFLPRDLYAQLPFGSRRYKNKFRLICGPNGDLIQKTVEHARKQNTLQAVGLAMHVLADTWAHTYFAGTPSMVINNTDYNFFELVEKEDGIQRIPIVFGHNPAAKEDPDLRAYTGSIYRSDENSIMNLGHGRAGHLPDYSFIRYAYTPSWDRYDEIVKDNPHDYLYAFAQMVYALKSLRDPSGSFETDTYAWDDIRPYEERIRNIITVRRTDSSADWKAFGEELSSKEIRDFSLALFENEFALAEMEDRKTTSPGKFFVAAINHKAMVVGEIERSGNLIAGRVGDASKNANGRKEGTE